MADEKRTLEINARLRDFASSSIKRLGSTFARVIRFSMLAPLRLLGAAIRGIRGLFTGLATSAIAAFAVIKGGQSIGEILNAADAMSKLARATSTSTEDLSALSVAFEFAGLDASRFTAIVTGLGRGISTALRTGRGPQMEAFDRLGISLEQLRSGNYPLILEQIADGIQGIGTEAEKAAVLQAIFPDNFQRLLPLLSAGGEEFRKLVEESRRFGGSLSTELGNAAESINDDLLRIRTTLSDISRSAILGALDTLRPYFAAIVQFLGDNRETLIGALQDLVVLFAEFVAWLGRALVAVVAFLSQGLDPLVEKVRKLLDFGTLGFIDLNIGSRLAEAFGAIPFSDISEKAKVEMDAAGRAAADAFSAAAAREFQNQPELLASVQAQGRSNLDSAALNFASARSADYVAAGQNPSEVGTPAVLAAGAERAGRLGRLGEDLGRLGDMDPSQLEGLVEPLDRLNRGLDEIPDNAEDAGAATDGFWSRFGAGAQNALAAWTNFAGTVQAAGEQLVDSGLDGLSNAFGEIILGTKSAKEAFREFGLSMLKTIAQLIPKLLIVKALSGISGLGGLGGGVALADGGVVPGVLKSTIPLRKFADGGIASSPTLALFGEGQGQEAFVPLKSGRIPVALKGAGGDQFVFAPTITAMDSKDVRRVLIEERKTITEIWKNAASWQNGTRRTVREAAR